MSAKKNFVYKLSMVVAVWGLVMTSSVLIFGQQAPKQTIGVPDDWTHHRLVFSNPGTAAEAMAAGRFEQWTRMVNDPRYQFQQLKRSLQQRALAVAPDFASRISILQQQAESSHLPPFHGRPVSLGGRPISKDWNMNLGPFSDATLTANVGSTLNSTTLPASSSFTLDNVTFNSSDPTAASKTGTFSGNPTNGQTVVITNPATSGTMTLTASPGTPGMQTGTFSSVPTATSSPITIVNGGNTLTVNTNATAANATGTFASFPLSNSSITVNPSGNTVTLTPNGNGAFATGTFSAAPLSTSTFSVTSGSNTLLMTPAGNRATIVGTAAAAPASNTQVILTSQSNTLTLSNGGTFADVVGTFTAAPLGTATISIQSGSNTLVMKPAGAEATIVGTAGATIPAATTTISLTSQSNTLTLSNGGTLGNYQELFTGNSSSTSSGSLVISYSGGSTTNTLTMTGGSSNACSHTGGTYTGTFTDTGSTTTRAGNFLTAINDCTSLGLTATLSSSTVTITEALPGNFLSVTSDSINAATPTSTAGTNGSNACPGSSSTAGTFATSNSSATLASNISAAINACNTGSAAVGATSVYSTGSTFTVTDAYPGLSPTFSGAVTNASGIFSWGTPTAGNDGSNSCASSSAGAFATSTVAATLASNLSSAINSCDGSFSAVGAGSVYTSGTTFTVTDSTIGAVTFSATNTNTTTPATFSWSAVVPGTNGPNTCASSTVGTYAATQTPATFASNLSAAISACNGSFAAVGATSVYSTGSTFTVTDAYPGLSPTFSGAVTNASGIFSWGGVTAGTNGLNSCASSTSGAFATSTVPATLASNLATAIRACNTSFAAVGATASYTSGNGFTVTDAYPGAAINTFTPTSANTTTPSTFSWSSVTSGTPGSNTCPGPSSPFTATFATSSAVGTLASNVVAAINACNAALGASAAVTTGGAFKVSTTALDTAASALTTSVSNGSGIFTWAPTVPGLAGSNGCTGSTTATYQYNSSTTTLANNLISALNLCTGSTGISTTSSNTGATATVTASTWTASPGVTLSPTAAGYFAWTGSTLTGGTSGANTLASFAIDNVNADAATNLAAAIVRNNGTVGVTAAAAGAVVTVTASAAGTTGNGITTTSGLAGFTAWTGMLAGGGDGTTDANDFAYWSGSTYASQSTIATNIATMLGMNGTITAAFTIGAAGSPTPGDIVLTYKTGGLGGNTQNLNSNFTALTGGLFSGGNTTQATAQYPAKYSFSTTDAGLCSNSTTPDYVVYNTNVPGSATQANIVAYDNIYTGCPAAGGASTVPLVYWSYQTGSGIVPTSPVLSGDGTKVAFMETDSSTGNATLRILRWNSGDGTDYNSPATPTNSFTNTTAGAGGNTAWSGCPAGSCMISVAFQTQTNTDSNSSPFYDYTSDTLWVGDDSGYLHKFTGVFNGTPGEVTTTWPALVRSNAVLSGPVLDLSRGLIFVGDSSGFLESVNTSTAAVIASGQIGYTSGVGIIDSPIVDPSAARVYTFVNRDSSGYGRVNQLVDPLTSGTTGNYNYFLSASTNPVYAGDFDNTYYTSSNAASPTGHLWFCGQPDTLYAVTITANAISNATAATAGPKISNDTTSPCSPVTEFYNGTTDYIFVSPQAQTGTALQSCTASMGCVISFTVSGTTATRSGSGAFAGGAGGMVIDTQNTTVGGTLQIYFGILGSNSGCTGAGGKGAGTGGCAVQASQTAP